MTERTIIDIVYDMKTQDDRITHLPVFAVEQKSRIFSIANGYTDTFVWIDESGMQAGHGDDVSEGGHFTKIGYKDIWSFVSAFFTEKGAEDFIKLNGHNLTSPRIYVHSGYRNYEWETLRKHLMEMERDDNNKGGSDGQDQGTGASAAGGDTEG